MGSFRRGDEHVRASALRSADTDGPAGKIVIADPEPMPKAKRAAYPIVGLVLALAIVAGVALRASEPDEQPITTIDASAAATSITTEYDAAAPESSVTSSVASAPAATETTTTQDVPATTTATPPAVTTPRGAAPPESLLADAVAAGPAAPSTAPASPPSSAPVSPTSSATTATTSPASTTTTSKVVPVVSFSISQTVIDNDVLRYEERPTLAWDVTPSAGFSVIVEGMDDAPWPIGGQPFTSDWPSGRRQVCPGMVATLQTATLCGPTLGDFDYKITVRDAAGTIVASQTLTLTITPVSL